MICVSKKNEQGGLNKPYEKGQGSFQFHCTSFVYQDLIISVTQDYHECYSSVGLSCPFPSVKLVIKINSRRTGVRAVPAEALEGTRVL